MRDYIHWKAEEDWPMRFAFGRSEAYYMLVRQLRFSMEQDCSSPELILTLELKKDLLLRIASLRWFDIPVLYLSRNPIPFDPALPISIQVTFKDWDMLLLYSPIPEGDAAARLKYLFGLLQNETAAYSPLNYRVLCAEQKQEARTVSFTWEQITNWENGK